ncbi:MAG: hypothetical protein J6X70_02280 [Muribaculaceae bacterium]|nr:hypothetical protein [Muribaculaceae bacterium]
MKTLILKQKWYASYKSAAYKRTLKNIFIVMLLLGALVGIFVGINLGTDTHSVWKGILAFFACALCGPILFATICFAVSLIVILFSLPIIIAPKTYTFGVNNGRFTLDKNDKSVIDVPLSDLTKFTFVTVKVNGFGGDPLGNELEIRYVKNGKNKKKSISLGCFYDDEKRQLYEFVQAVVIPAKLGLFA